MAAEALAGSSRRLLDGVKALDEATSLSEALDALTTATAAEAGRAAMLVVKGDRILGWRTTGHGELDAQPNESSRRPPTPMRWRAPWPPGGPW